MTRARWFENLSTETRGLHNTAPVNRGSSRKNPLSQSLPLVQINIFSKQLRFPMETANKRATFHSLRDTLFSSFGFIINLSFVIPLIKSLIHHIKFLI